MEDFGAFQSVGELSESCFRAFQDLSDDSSDCLASRHFCIDRMDSLPLCQLLLCRLQKDQVTRLVLERDSTLRRSRDSG